MNIKNNPILLSVLMMLVMVIFTVTPVTAAAGQVKPSVGSVTLVIGSAYVINTKGQKRKLKRSDFIFEGDSVETNSGAHVHIKFIDDARISIRPESRLNIESYHYDQETPKNSEIRFYLHKGVLRSISGKATEAAHERYRMNTPIAALGVLGTDYMVRTDLKTTWAAVYSGAISLAPINDGCNHLGLGTCVNATKLTAKMGSKYLEVNIGDTRSQLKSQVNGVQQYDQTDTQDKGSDVEQDANQGTESEDALTSNDKLVDSSQNAVGAEDKGSNAGQGVKQDKIGVGLGVDVDDKGLASNDRLVILPVDQPVIVPPEPDDQPIVIPPVLPSGLAWVRWPWQAGNSADTVSEAKSPDNEEKKITVGNFYAGLFRAPNTLLDLQPQAGVFNFTLQNSHVVFIENGEQWQDATAGKLDKAELQIDFAKRQFNTQLQASHQQTGTVDLNVTGSVSNDGLFRGEGVNGNVAGALTLDGKNAGLQFQKNLDNGSLQGITEWQR